MKVVTAEEMRHIDNQTIKKVGIPSTVLMERAGAAVASRIKELYSPRKVVVLCGSGNNGGDGLVVARELFNAGWHVLALVIAHEHRMSPDCLAQYRIIKQIGVPTEFRTRLTAKDLHSALVVDALLGTGLNKTVEGPLAKVIAFINNSCAPVCSIDIPSGIASDTGQIMGVAVKADHTVTFGLPKRGHLLYPGAEYTGRLCVEDIGFPTGLLSSARLKVERLEKEMLLDLMPERPRCSHKGEYGHVFIVAGSRGKTGAALMAAKACMRTGSGLVTIGVPESLMNVFQSRVTEEMTLPLPDRGDGTLSDKAAEVIVSFVSEKADILCIGPGIGVSVETEKIVNELIRSSRAPLVIDADGLNAIRTPAVLKRASAPVIITPHPGEMSRLMRYEAGASNQQSEKKLRVRIEEDRIGTALSFSKRNKTYLVLKGAPTIIADPEGRVFINSTGNPGMASGGTGDVLTGMVASLLGQGVPPLDASCLGVYLHGLAGDIAAEEKGMHSLIASDIVDSLPKAFACMLAP